MAEEGEDLRLAQFLLAMAEKMPNPTPNPAAGLPVRTILESEGFCTPHNIRCVCGIAVPSPGDQTITCSVCSRLLHMACLSLPDRLELQTYICPFCQFRSRNSDPLTHLGNWLGDIYNTVRDAKQQFDRAAAVHDRIRSTEAEPNRAELYQSQYRVDSNDRRNANDVLTIYDDCCRLRDKFAELESPNF